MKIASRLLLPTLLLGAPLVLAAEAPTPAPTPTQAAPAEKRIDVSFRGTLRDAIKRIAEDGGLNVVATGDLDTSVEVHLKGVTAEQVLRIIARTYSLRLDQDGSIYTLRPMTAAEKETASANAAPSTPDTASANAAPSTPDTASAVPAPPPGPPPAGVPPVPPVGIGPPMPPMPPMPPSVAGNSDEEIDPDEIQDRVRKEMRKTQRRHRGERDVVARGHSLEVNENDVVDSAVVYGGNLVVKGHVEKDAVAFGGNLDVYGRVEGDASAFNGNVILHPGSAVEGDVSAIGGNVIREDGAEVEGSIESFGGGNVGRVVAGQVKDTLKKEFRKERAEAEDEEEDHGGGLPGFLIRFAALFGLGFLGQLFMPTRMKELSSTLKEQPIKSGLVGFLGALALIPITVVLTITLIGIPVMVALLLVAALATVLGFTAVASEIGMRVPILRGRKTQAVVLAVGLLILLGLGAIPGVGWLVTVPATFMGFGAAILTRFGNRLRGIPEPLSRSSIGV
jgi:cytoskeletal protein CcmA (bactofilin family)